MNLENLKPGMIFIANEPVFAGKRQLHVYRVVTAPSANTSFTVEVLNVSEKKLQIRYWKSREWEAMAPHFYIPSLKEQRDIIKAIFTATNK
jgi:hypothetical protein